MSNNAQEYIEKMTMRYVYAATRFLPASQRKDMTMELESTIDDMLRERVGDRSATEKDIDIVLMELGNPVDFVYKASGKEEYLIGPHLFPKYCMVLRIVLIAVLAGISIATILLAFLEETSGIQLIFGLIVNLFGAVAVSWSFITLLFALIQRQNGKLTVGLIHAPWSPANLQPVPQSHEKITRGEPIAGIIFTVLVMLLFARFSSLCAAFINTDAGLEIIPVFDEAVLRTMRPLLLTAMALGLIREATKLLEGRYTMRLAIVTVSTDAISFALCWAVFSDGRIFNGQFATRLIAECPQLTEVAWVFEQMPLIFIGVLIFAFAMDASTILLRTLKYRNKT